MADDQKGEIGSSAPLAEGEESANDRVLTAERHAGGEYAVPPEEYFLSDVELHDMELRESAMKWINPTFTGAVILTYVIIFLQGFGLWGFELEESFLNWLGVVTVGEIAGLVAIAFRYVFSRSDG